VITRVLGWIGGGGLMPWAIGAALLLIAGLGGLWRLEAAQRDAAELRLAGAESRLATANAALDDRANVIAALDRQAQATRELAEELEPTRRVIYAAPRTVACVASPVIRAGIDSLRAARARAAAAPGIGPVAGPAGVPAAPAGAGDRTGR
jgi:hypothetical protein